MSAELRKQLNPTNYNVCVCVCVCVCLSVCVCVNCSTNGVFLWYDVNTSMMELYICFAVL